MFWKLFEKHFEKHEDLMEKIIASSCIIALGFVSLEMCKYLHLFYPRNFNFSLNCLIDFWHIVFKVLVKTHAPRWTKRSTLTCVMLLSFRRKRGASCRVLIMEIYAFQLARFFRFLQATFVRQVRTETRGNKGKFNAALRNNLHLKGIFAAN